MFYSGDEDQAQERINKLAKILKEHEVGSTIRAAGVRVISCIIQRDEGRAPMRHSFHWSEEKLYYAEEPLLRHLEPPLSIYLELVSYFFKSLYFSRWEKENFIYMLDLKLKHLSDYRTNLKPMRIYGILHLEIGNGIYIRLWITSHNQFKECFFEHL